MNKILVIAPATRTLSPAMHRAIAYARQTGATPHLVRFDYYGPIDYSRRIFGAEVADRARRDYLEESARVLEAQAREMAEKGVAVDSQVVWAPRLLEAVIHRILELQPELVLKDIESDTGGGLMHPQPVDWKLMRLCPAPLLLVHPRSRRVPQWIVASVDVMVPPEEAAFNDEIMRSARELANLSGAQLALVSVFSYIPMDAYGAGFVADVYEIMDDTHREALEAFATAHDVPKLQVQRVVNFNTASGVAEVAAKLPADLIVLGSTYHGGWHRLMFGATAESLLRQLHCDALLLKPEGFRHVLCRHMQLDVGQRSQRKVAVA